LTSAARFSRTTFTEISRYRCTQKPTGYAKKTTAATTFALVELCSWTRVNTVDSQTG
jgi:hypothetical protein